MRLGLGLRLPLQRVGAVVVLRADRVAATLLAVAGGCDWWQRGDAGDDETVYDGHSLDGGESRRPAPTSRRAARRQRRTASESRISRSRITSALSGGGADGAAAACSLAATAIALPTPRTIRKMMKATMTKLTTWVRNSP